MRSCSALLPSALLTFALLASALALAPGCMIVFGDDDDDDVCLAQELSLIAPQRNPETLTCQQFGGCDLRCGPCPLTAERAPLPSWGFCGSPCEALGEAACAASPECRVVKDAACAVGGACLTDFLGCFPTDQSVDASIDCFEARDGSTCSQSPACTAYHRSGLGTTPEIPSPFAMCAPEGVSPGSCAGEVLCRALPPACPAGHTPGVSGGCYSGACIPNDVCELQPSPA